MEVEVMMGKRTRRMTPAALLVIVALAPAQPAAAVEEPDFILPAGIGCDFNLGVTATGGNLHTEVFVDKNGNTVRTITAGKGVDLTYTNYGTDPDHPAAGESVTVKTAGSVTKTVFNSDGTSTVTSTGHNGLILFPSDIPAGPTTTHYVGKLVYAIDAYGVFTVISSSGQQRDICAELAS
jgi:hypothetical protein